MNIQNLINISLDEAGITLLVSLPAPHKSPLAKANKKELLELCKVFRKLWGELIIDQVNLPDVKLKNMPKDMIVPTTKEEIWDSLFLTITFYYDYSFTRFKENETQEKWEGLPSGLNLNSIKNFIPQEVSKIDKYYILRVLSFEYFTCLFSLNFIALLKIPNFPPALKSTLVSSYHNSVFELHRHCVSLPDRNKKAGTNLLFSVLKYAKGIFIGQPYDTEYKPGKFSFINTEELSLIARRDSTVVKRYGIKSLEKLFERQLVLIIQSFGVYVVSTRTDTRTVDLICISPFPDGQYTFLVEAKTTDKPYSLPMKDFRALKDYVKDVRSTLNTLPPLRFVLLSAYKPSKTLGNKLREFQAVTGVPIRFISSQQISSLRENVVGLLQLDIFADMILNSSYILENDFVSIIDTKQANIQNAHAEFIEKIFVAKGILPNFGRSNSDE